MIGISHIFYIFRLDWLREIDLVSMVVFCMVQNETSHMNHVDNMDDVFLFAIIEDTEIVHTGTIADLSNYKNKHIDHLKIFLF